MWHTNHHSIKMRISLLLLMTILTVIHCDHVDNKDTMAVGTAIVSVSYIDTNGENLIQTDEGRYGYRSVMHPKQGNLIHVRTSDNKTKGCSPFVNAPTASGEPWIALIERGECKFDSKITNAVLHEASAVVVYDHEHAADILIMDHEGKTY